MDRRRLNDRIFELCERVVTTPPGAELNQIFRELQTALGEHNSRLRNTVLSPVPNRRKPNKSERPAHSSRAGRWVL